MLLQIYQRDAIACIYRLKGGIWELGVAFPGLKWYNIDIKCNLLQSVFSHNPKMDAVSRKHCMSFYGLSLCDSSEGETLSKNSPQYLRY